VATPCFRALRGADRDRDPGRIVPGAASRYGQRGQTVRPRDVHLVCHTRSARPMADPRRSERSAGAPSHSRGHPVCQPWLASLRGARRRRPGGDGGGGAIRRHGAFWSAADPVCVVQLCHAGAPAQLFRPRGAPNPRPRRGGQPLLSACASMGALSHGGVGDLGYGDSLAGGHFGGVLAYAPSNSTRLSPAARNPPHLGARDRPGISDASTGR
jgi:hypothetical protein